MKKSLYKLGAVALSGIMCGAMVLPYAYGHGLGQILSKSVGDYYLTLEYEALTIQAGTPVRLTLDIFPKNAFATSVPEYTDVWVRITETNTNDAVDPIVFAGAISKKSFIPTGMSYVFPRGGNYEVSVRFENGDAPIGEAAFEVVADNTPGELQSSGTIVGWTILGAAAGAALAYAVARKRR
jgi:hypothetical protein